MCYRENVCAVDNAASTFHVSVFDIDRYKTHPRPGVPACFHTTNNVCHVHVRFNRWFATDQICYKHINGNTAVVHVLFFARFLLPEVC